MDPKKREMYDNYGELGLRESVLEIDLAYKTLLYIGSLTDEDLLDFPGNIRSLGIH